jgi:quercetin dioxygenase-like cupin family protein
MNTIKQSHVFQVSNEIQWENAGPGIQRQVFGYDDKIMLVKVKFEKGAVGSLHQHFHSQATYVESGVFELTIGDEKNILKKGDGYYVPPNVIHGCICIEPGLLIDVFSPLRQDFLQSK